MKTPIIPDVRVNRSQPVKQQKTDNRSKIVKALESDGEARVRVSFDVYDPKAQTYSMLRGVSLIVRCRSIEAVGIVLDSATEVVEALDQLRLRK